jgi:hypothetical protein
MEVVAPEEIPVSFDGTYKPPLDGGTLCVWKEACAMRQQRI